jgi:ABC-type dipeptide/oligopeptide/nickel transport system permease subunit
MTDTTELTQPRPRRVRAGSSWTGFALRRLGGLAGTVVIAVVVTFVIVPLIPGDPAVSAAGPDATIDQINRVRAELGLDRPLYERFFDYVGGLPQGDLGHSFSLNAPVSEVVFRRLPFTAGLSFLALLVVLVLAVPLGMAIGALTRGGKRRRLDSTFNYVTAVVAAIPPYVMATLLVLLFAVTLEVLPPAYTRSQPGLSLLLPAFALSLPSICLIARVVRRETAVVLEQDFLRTRTGLAAVRAADGAAVRAAERAHQHAHAERHHPRRHARRRDQRGDRVRLARARARRGERGRHQGLPAGAGHRAGPRGAVGADDDGRRRPARHRRPEGARRTACLTGRLCLVFVRQAPRLCLVSAPRRRGGCAGTRP